jgi:DNA-binding ferritin-like protein
MQTKLAMFEYLKLQAFIMHFCMNGLTVYNVHVMFEISAKTIYMKEIIA